MYENIIKKLRRAHANRHELGKNNRPNWLKRKWVKSEMHGSIAPTHTCVKELITKIKDGLAAELEQKVKKVRV